MEQKSNDIQQKREAAAYRSSIYGLLAAIFRQEITPGFLGTIKEPRFLETLHELGIKRMDAFFSKQEPELIEELAAEYARLLLGPGKHVSPYESVHHERNGGDWGKLWGASTVVVKKFIESTGLTLTEDHGGIPDHIAVELEFMQQLSRQESEAWQEGDAVRAEYLKTIEKKFLEDHLVQWVPKFCTQIEAQAELPFYREMAALTRNFVEFEHAEL